jgi:hypothetical protein
LLAQFPTNAKMEVSASFSVEKDATRLFWFGSRAFENPGF